MARIDDDKVKWIGAWHKIDKVNTKITGLFILKVFMPEALQHKPIPLSSMEFLTNPDKSLSAALKSKDKSQQTLEHSSIGQRLKGANVEFFQDIYEDIAKKFHTKFPSEKSFPVWDSPILTISNNFMHNGSNLGGAEKDTPNQNVCEFKELYSNKHQIL